MWSEEYATPAAFWAAVTSRSKSQARTQGRRPQDLTGELVRQILLARVFRDPDTPWVVAGGTGMLIRLPGARNTSDLDLVHRNLPTTADLAAAITSYTGLNDHDPFDYQVLRTDTFAGEIAGVKLRIRALIGGRRAHEFDIDLTTKPAIGSIQSITPTNPITGLRGITYPPVTLWPVASQTADKLAAMYRHTRSDQPPVSTRYRDLVDLVLLATQTSVTSTDLAKAISQVRTAGYNLPNALHDPGGQWSTRYPTTATDTRLPKHLHYLDTALEVVGAWLNPILDGTTAGDHSWDPHSRRWVPGPEVEVRAEDAGGLVFVDEHTRNQGHTSVTSHHRRRPRLE